MRFCVFGIALLCLQTFVLGQFGGRPPFFRPGRIEVLGSSPFGPPMFRPPPFFGSGDFTPSFGGGEFGGPFPGFGGPGPFGGPFRGGPPITTGGPGGPGRPGFPTGPGFETAGPGGIGGTFGGPGPMPGGRGPGGPPGPTRPGGPTGPMGPTDSSSSGFFTDPTTDRRVQVVPSDTASAVRTARTGGFGGMGGFGDGSSRFGGGPGGPGGDGRFPTFSGTATGGFTPRGDIFGGSGFDPRMSGSDPRFSGDSRSATGMDGRGMDFGRTGSFTGRTGDFGRPADFGGRSADFGRTGDFGSRPSEFGRGGDVGRSSMDRTGISDSMGRGQGVIRIRIPVDGQAVITRDGVTEPLPAGTSLQDLGITGDFGGRGTIDTTVSGSSMMTPSQGMGGPPRDSGMTFTSTVSQTDNTGVVGGNTFVTTSTTETGAPSISGAPGGPDLVVMNMEDLRDPRNLDAIYKALAEISSGGTVSGSTQSGTPVMS